MAKKPVGMLVAILVLISMLFTSCAPAPAATPETVTIKETVMVTEVVEVEKVITSTPLPPTPEPGKKIITWWSHWANEPARRQVIETIIADYEAAHPDVDIIISWWDAAPLADATTRRDDCRRSGCAGYFHRL